MTWPRITAEFLTFGNSQMAYETITIPSVELFATGCHNDDCYDLNDLHEMVKNSQIIKQKPVIKIGHHDQQNFEWPSLGYVDRLRVVGNKLVGDLIDVPKKLGLLIKSGAYGGKSGGGRSAEIFWNFRDGSGRLFRRVFKAISLLGENWAAVSDLAPLNLDGIEALYSRSNTSGICYDSRGQCYKRYEMPMKRAQTYSIKKVGTEFHVTTATGLVMGSHTNLLAAERQRKELSAK